MPKSYVKLYNVKSNNVNVSVVWGEMKIIWMILICLFIVANMLIQKLCLEIFVQAFDIAI